MKLFEYTADEKNEIRHSYANELHFDTYENLLDYIKTLNIKNIQYKILQELINILENDTDNYDTLDDLINEYKEFINQINENYHFNLLCFEKIEENI